MRAVDFDLPDEDDPRRLEVRAWLHAHPHPSPRDLARAGYVAPHWPAPWGLDADPVHQILLDDELARAEVKRPSGGIAIGWAGPTLLHAGTPEQKRRHLWPILEGEVWCQLFSEPAAGSDLARLATRAVRDGDEYVVTGSKIWTSGAHRARYGILLARTDPDQPKHQGVSYFVCPMDLPGITVRPLVDMTGQHLFNEVFFDDVRIPADHLVGEENRGWTLAKVTLGNERISLSGGGALWGGGPSAFDLLDVVRRQGGTRDAVLRQRLAQLYIEADILRLIRLRTVTAAVRGEPPGAEASVRKALADRHGRTIMNLAKDLAGPAGMLAGTGPLGAEAGPWHHGFLFSSALEIGGGTSEVQRNIIGERVLGLPHDIDVEVGRTWASARVPEPAERRQ